MTFTQISHNTARDGNTYRVTAGSTHCTVGGKLTPLAEAVAVTRDDKTGQYVVSCGKEWITLTPEVRKVDSLVKAVVEAGRFGDVIREYDDDVRYLVAHSSGVTKGQNGWKFDGVADANVGMFFGDWEAKWPGKTTIADGMVSLDTRGLTGELNLDPETYPASAANRFAIGAAVTWAVASGAASGLTVNMAGDAFWFMADARDPYVIERSRGTFDVSAINGTVLSVVLRLTSTTVWTPVSGYTLQIYKATGNYSALTNDQSWDDFRNVGNQLLKEQDISAVAAEETFTLELDKAIIDVAGESAVYLYGMSSWDFDQSIPNSLRSQMRTEGTGAATDKRPALIVTMVSGGRMLRGIGG